MKNRFVTQKLLRPSLAGVLLAALALPAGAVDLKTADGDWTFSIAGNVNVDYIYSSCQDPKTQVNPPSPGNPGGIAAGLTCVGSASSNSVSNIQNGLLPAAFVFGVATTQNGIDLAAHLGLYPGIATNNSGNPNIGPLGCNASANSSCNAALGTTGLDVRQVYMTFGTKTAGTFTLGRNIGLFGADVILNDMTLPGVGAPGNAATPYPANTTLGGIGFGYIYTDWLAQIDYTTPKFSGFDFTLGVFDPINSLTDAGTAEPKKSPGFHAKATFTLPFSDTSKLYASIAYLTQQQNYVDPAGTPYSYTGNGVDVFIKLDVSDFEAFGYYYHATGLGTTALFYYGAFGDGQTRTSDGFLAQATYKFGALKLGVNYGESRLDTATGEVNPFLVAKNKKATGGLYYSLTKNLTLLAEYSNVKSDAQTGGTNTANTFNVGAYLGF